MSATQRHPDDVFHVLLDAIDALLDSEERQPWEGYDEGMSPMGDSNGYMATLRDARAFATAALNKGRSADALRAVGCTGSEGGRIIHDGHTCPIHEP